MYHIISKNYIYMPAGSYIKENYWTQSNQLLCLVEKILWIVELNLSRVKTSQYRKNSS